MNIYLLTEMGLRQVTMGLSSECGFPGGLCAKD